MKVLLTLLTLLSFNAFAIDAEGSPYLERPLSCPLRFSELSLLRDQVQMLVSSLGQGCTQNNQQAINQLNLNVANLEGIANTFNNYSSSNNSTSTAQYARNVGQVLGNINLISSNNACFYDIRSRGLLPVLSDVVMSVSQLGLLIPSGTGAVVAAGGYVAGSTIRIIHELVKKKFNFSKPEERRAFIQLNCAFFDNRRMMDESGIFNPESETFRNKLLQELRKERVELIKAKKQSENLLTELEETLNESLTLIPSALNRNLDARLFRKMEEVYNSLSQRPGDYAQKISQVSILTERIEDIIEGVKVLKLSSKVESSRELLLLQLEKVAPDFRTNGKAWTNNFDEYEMQQRGPIIAFLTPVLNAFRQDLNESEIELSVIDPERAKQIAKMRLEIKENKNTAWSINLRLASLNSKIETFERPRSDSLFSENDEGSSNIVEILDYYRTIQKSILGKEGKDYLKNALKTAYSMQAGVDGQLRVLNSVTTPQEICAAAEKTRFAWTQYRFKVQEAHDFVATNLDLYRSSFRIGKEKLKGAASFVLNQIESVQIFLEESHPKRGTVGHLMEDVTSRINLVERKLQDSGCF